ncbi:probable inactive peptidyl-prolyl cis-trans isomerase-like 6 isoform X2 [Alosa sapidissima]|uniref:probable inactive peptidyl-prolyl cis-trans isomerase-like 6 isoform X2 n=1 Tax=Alosa sapidissima TaxID=34773 RepID=UPI001C0A0B6B|nr:probable inactive peptidyl-prolyl cis-trans isomerase-like 6 isoform X2 [Alosa sapidissima]
MASKQLVEVVGLMKEHNFQIAKSIAEGLKQKFPSSFADPTIHPLLECDWHTYLNNKKRELRGEVWQFDAPLMVYLSGRLIGDEKELARWAHEVWGFTLHRPHALNLALAEDYYTNHLRDTGHMFVYMDVEIRGVVAGRLLFELFCDICPKTCANFRALCTGEKGLSDSDLMLAYKGSLIHRVVPNGWIQGGDINPAGKGNGGESIYGPTFEDESFAVSHNKRGVLGMANQGPHSNGSQFYVTLQPAPWMDRKYVAFGQLVEGTEVLKSLEDVPTQNERPKVDCRVKDCGEFQL